MRTEEAPFKEKHFHSFQLECAIFFKTSSSQNPEDKVFLPSLSAFQFCAYKRGYLTAFFCISVNKTI